MIDFGWAGRTVIVTGSAQGIGRGIAERFLAGGATVVIADHDGEKARTTADELRAGGGEATPFAVDVTREDQVDELVAFADGLGDGLWALVNNAGVSGTRAVEEIDPASWRRALDVNLTGPYLCSRAAVPVLRRRGGGKIVNVASVAGKRISYNADAAYTASKAGLLAFTRHLAYEVARDRINVNAVCPGPVASPMLLEHASADTLRARTASVPAGRLTTIEDQADAIAFLCSAAADMIQGVALDVDGGALLGWYDVDTYFARRRQN
jgi:NAD(P)-dependent dehydrogenase (short-subunit alcohol dehydrogenase family)